MNLTESTDSVEHSHELCSASNEVINLAISQSDFPLTSLEEGESRIRLHMHRAHEEMYNYEVMSEPRKLREVKTELMEAQAIGLRMLTMINAKIARNALKRQPKKP